MADYWANNNGAWSTVSNWLTSVGQTAGVLPTSADDVYSNNKVIYVDGNYRVNSISNRASTNIAAGGYFVMNNGFSLSADVFGGGVSDVACLQFLSAAPASASLVGNLNCLLSPFVLRPVAFINSSSGTFNIRGNLDGGINNGQNAVLSTSTNGLIINNGTGNLNLDGFEFYADTRVVGADTKLVGIRNNSTGNISIIGDIYGGTSIDSYGLYNLSSGSIFVIGSIYAGNGVGAVGLYNNSTGSIVVNGAVLAGNIGSNSTGMVNVSGEVVVAGGVFGGLTDCFGYSVSGGTTNIYGDVEGGFGARSYGINDVSISTPRNIFVFGDVKGGIGTSSHGFNNALGQGVNRIVGNVFGGLNPNAAGIANNSEIPYSSSTTFVEISGNVIGDVGPAVLNSGLTTVSISGNISSTLSRGGVENTSSGRLIFINGNCLGDTGLYTVLNSSSATISIVGTVSGGKNVNSLGIENRSNGLVLIIGNVFGGNGTSSHGIRNSSTGFVFVSGQVIGGNGLNSNGIYNFGTGLISLTGSTLGGFVSGSSGVYNLSSGTVNVFGSSIGGFASSGAENVGRNGIMRISKVVGNDFGPSLNLNKTYQAGVFGLSGSITIVDEIECGLKGVFPTKGIVYTSNSKDAIASYKNQSYETLSMFNYVSGSKYVPLPKDVRFKEFYSLNSLSGTLIVPNPINVSVGVPVDNTLGTLIPSLVWNVPLSAINTIGSMGLRIKKSPLFQTLDILIERLS